MSLLCLSDNNGSDQHIDPCIAAWFIRTAVPFATAILCLAVYLIKYPTTSPSSGTGDALCLPIHDSLAQGNDHDDHEPVVLEGGILVPVEGARALDHINATRSHLRTVLTALLSCNVILLATGAATADNSMTAAVEVLHTLFGAGLLAAAITIPPSRIFPLVIVLAADAFSALVQLRIAVLDIISPAHALPIASAVTILLAFTVATIEYNR
ncbi:hypothetical protein BC828DRAFT_409976, partial [Blastocladiella britannica]